MNYKEKVERKRRTSFSAANGQALLVYERWHIGYGVCGGRQKRDEVSVSSGNLRFLFPWRIGGGVGISASHAALTICQRFAAFFGGCYEDFAVLFLRRGRRSYGASSEEAGAAACGCGAGAGVFFGYGAGLLCKRGQAIKKK